MHPELHGLRDSLARLRDGSLSAAAFSARARQSRALLDALPPRFEEVLQGLLVRLEASTLFTEESCSFSHRDLLDSLQLWLDKAAARLAPPAAP